MHTFILMAIFLINLRELVMPLNQSPVILILSILTRQAEALRSCMTLWAVPCSLHPATYINSCSQLVLKHKFFCSPDALYVTQPTALKAYW